MLTIFLPIFLALFTFWHFVWKRRGLPPGPTPIPLFGNTLALKGNAYLPFQQWTKEFGPIFTVWIGDEPTVMVTEYGLMRDLFIKEGDAYAGREFQTELITKFTATKGKNGGVFRVEGEPWKVMRRFSLQALRNLGMGRAALEQQFLSDISNSINEFREKLAANENFGESVDLQKEINILIASTISRVLFGYAFKGKHSDEFYELKAIMEEMVSELSTTCGQMTMTRPWLRHLPIFSGKFERLDRNFGCVMAFMDRRIQGRIAERKAQNYEGNEEPRDLLDYFLDQMDLARQGKGDAEFNAHFTMDNLRILCADLFMAGQETTATTLSFLVLYLMLDQRVQGKMQAELDELEGEKGRNGFGEWVTQADRPKLPYLCAVINEVQRVCNLLPINLSHRTMCDVEILGGKFKLKKGTTITPQICCVLLDEKIFPNPNRFEPERFLDANEQLKKCEELIPFSLGKRICLGESMAKTELFLFTANFFRIFKVYPVDPLNPPSSAKKFDFAVKLQPYKCRLQMRQKAVEMMD